MEFFDLSHRDIRDHDVFPQKRRVSASVRPAQSLSHRTLKARGPLPQRVSASVSSNPAERGHALRRAAFPSPID
jgi:hypothetical protein